MGDLIFISFVFAKWDLEHFAVKSFRDMGQTNIKCFAVFFAALVLLQNTYADVSVNFDENADERSKTETGSKDLVEIDTNEAREKS